MKKFKCKKSLLTKIKSLIIEIVFLITIALICWLYDQYQCRNMIINFQFHAWWHVIMSCVIHKIMTLVFTIHFNNKRMKKIKVWNDLQQLNCRETLVEQNLTVVRLVRDLQQYIRPSTY